MIGYSTGTFDVAHRGHFRILKYMKSMCDKLIIGLTTDRLAIKQKRQTIVPFEDRRAVLENCKWVDLVVEHDGDDKGTALKKLRFDILFIGDDYYNTDEYKAVEDQVKIIYVPRSNCVSTTDLVKRIERNFFDRWSVISHGISGTLYGFDDQVIKPIHVGSHEVGTTKDVYDIAMNPPRNWKGHKSDVVHPMIAGVNSNRELRAQPLIKDMPWSTYLRTKCVSINLKCDKSKDILKERQSPSEVYWIVQKHVAQPLSAVWPSIDQENMKEKVFAICEDLTKMDIIHGDIHLDNLLIDNEENLYLIDFGWCSHPSFTMNREEFNKHKTMIETGWDWKHFLTSIQK